MKTNLFLLLTIFIFIFSSCENSDLISENDNLPTLRATPTPNNLGYESSIPIWRYYYYESPNYGDHYYGKERPETEIYYSINTIKGRNYAYELQDFNILAQHTPGVTIPLYRHRSIDNSRHRLSTSANNTQDPNKSGYTNDELLGYIFQSPYPGTIPLREIWLFESKNYSYVALEREREWQEQNMPGAFTSYGIIGYVLPGKRSEIAGKKAETVTIAVDHPMRGLGIKIVQLNVKEELRLGILADRTLTYNINLNEYGEKNIYEEKTFELAGAYTLNSITLYYSTNSIGTIQKLNNIPYNINVYFQHITGELGHAIEFKADKIDNNYKFTFKEAQYLY